MREQLKIDKMVFAITKEAFTAASREFAARMKAGTLPEKKPIERYPEETVKEMTSEEKVLALFGKDSVEIL